MNGTPLLSVSRLDAGLGRRAILHDVALSIADTKVKAQPSHATIDSHDRLFVADANGNVTFSFDRASELASGKHRPDRTIGSRELIAPNRLLVVEHVAQ